MKPHRRPLSEFPDVVIHAEEFLVKRHTDYSAAKAGDIEAADRLVADTLNRTAVEQVKQLIQRQNASLVPVHALETTGVNEIPAAMARALSQMLKLPVCEDIAQVNTVGHTGAGGYHRLAHQATFDGAVEAGHRYLLIDDFVGQGGTLANLRGHILAKRGDVLGATVLTGKPYSSILAPDSEQSHKLRVKHGQELENWWREEIGHGFDDLTRSEARYLENSPDADTIRSRIATARLKTGNPPPA